MLLINTFNFQIKTLHLYKYQNPLILFYLTFSPLLLLTFPDLKRFQICAIQLQKNFSRLKCINCSSQFKLGFSIVPLDKFKKLTIITWNWFCSNCSENLTILSILKLYYSLDDSILDLFQLFIKTIKGGVKSD